MNTIKGLIQDLAALIYPWISDIATAMLVCILIVLAPDLNRVVKRMIGAKNFLVRTLIFILINAFGFGLLIVWASPHLAATLSSLSPVWLMAVLSISFIFIGVWAERQRQA
ncbi:DUF3392 domain-containing protein [Shewanella sp.]|uniref:DUF3392 domain-containing protein n=1 Tax=Shewanella sp. TaxID=50422 RepID=UPI0035691F66